MSSWDTNPWSNFCDPHWELIYHNKWHPGTSEISTPREVAEGAHFHSLTWHKNYLGIFTCWWSTLLVTTSKFGLVTIRRHSATRKHLFPYPQDERSGMRKPKKDKHQHQSQLTTSVHLPSPISTDLPIKPDSVFTNPIGKDGVRSWSM